MKKIFSLLLLLTSHISYLTSLHAQTFQRAYGGTRSETGTSIQPTLDGNYIIGGGTASFGNLTEDFYLLKVDPAGSLLWSKIYGGTANDRSYYAYTCSDGGFVLTGYSYSYTANFPADMDLFLVRTDSDGNLLWSKTVGGTKDDFGWFVLQTSDGGYLTTGSTNSFSGNGGYDGYLVKFDSGGNLQWTKTIGGTGGDDLFSIQKTSDAGYIVSGRTSSNGFGSSDYWLIKLDANADTMWTKQYGTTGEESGNAVRQTADGGYILTGDLDLAGLGTHGIGLMKTNSAGNIQWVKRYGGSVGEFSWHLQQTQDMGYLIVGSTPNFGGGGKDVIWLKTDSVGNMLWAKAYGSSAPDDSWYFQQTSDGGYLMAGATQSFGSGQWDIYLQKIDSTGSSSSCFEFVATPSTTTPVLQVRSGTTIGTGGIQNTVTAISGTPSTATIDICPPPVSAFTASSDTICVNGCINFTDQSTNSPTGWAWTFAGGTPSSSTSQSPTNICYATSGTYTVTLIASNANGSDTSSSTVTVSTCLGTEENNMKESFTISPNPFSVETTLKINNSRLAIEYLQLKIYDVFGREIFPFVTRNSDSFVIHRGNLPSGIYFYKLLSDNKVISNEKIIIQ